MKIISWNVNGIRAAWNHGLSLFLDEENADIYCFQETKVGETINMLELEGYYPFWAFSERKNYSGTLCLSRIKPISHHNGIKGFSSNEGRVITLEFDEFYLINCYVPNSQHSYERGDFRQEWDKAFYNYAAELMTYKPIIICGDFNVAFSNKDIYEQSKWFEINSQGFQSVERENLGKLIDLGLTDTFRMFHPDDTDKFSWWSNRKFKRKENRGWRLDYFLADNRIKGKIISSDILDDVYGSDHCPISIEADLCLYEKAQIVEKPIQRKRYKYSDLKFIGYSEFLKCNAGIDLSSIWDSIDWEQAESNLRTMQEALAKSAYTKDLNLVEKWQKRIVFSLDAKVLAVRHVCNTALSTGIDGIAWKNSHEKMSAALSLTAKGYVAAPSRLLIMKCKNGKERRIHVETHFDRAMQTLYAYALDPVSEAWADRKSFAFRKGRSALDLNEYVKLALSGENAPEWIFIGDVRQCYENISHEWIKKHIPLPLEILNQFLEAGYVVSGDLFPNETGVGIGTTIAPIIANMTLDGLQEHIYTELSNGKRVVYPIDDFDFANGNLIRYADDIIITARSKELAEKFMKWTSDFLEERGLTLSKEKSKIINVGEEDFEFMSRHYSKRNGNIYVSPSEKSVEKFKANICELLDNFSGSQQTLIEKINRKIDGWCTYHKIEEAEEVFKQLDLFIKAALLDLCHKKHPTMERSKILEKYWYKDYDGLYYYALPERKDIRVKSLSDTILVTHYAVKTGVNPYIDYEYYEKRTEKRSIRSVTGKYRNLWNKQNGCCYYCGKPILRDEDRDVIQLAGFEKNHFLVYVHQRCLYSSLEYIDTEEPPDRIQDIYDLLNNSGGYKRTVSKRYYSLYKFFRASNEDVIKLTFRKIEDIMGANII